MNKTYQPYLHSPEGFAFLFFILLENFKNLYFLC
jgi:hypothetical protein